MAQALPAFMVEDMAARAAAGPAPDKLQAIQQKAKEARDLKIRIAFLEEQTKEANDTLMKIQRQELPDMLNEAGIDKLGIEAEGNLPAYDLTCKPYYHAKISNEDETAGEAYKWWEKHDGAALIKRTFIIDFGKGQEKAAKVFEKLLKTNKIDYDVSFGVPWNTLTAFIRETIEVRKIIPPLPLFNATVGSMATLKERKPPKEKAASKSPQRY